MRLPADYHMHTPLCRHATGEPCEYAARAVELGFTEIGFSDHAPAPREDFDNWRMTAAQLDEYVAKVQRARARYPQLAIRLAIEVDYIPGQEEWIRHLAGRHPWDYLIGSVHYVVDGWDVDNPYRLSEWSRHKVDDVWTAYIDLLCQSAQSGLFHIIGHCDLAKKFGHRSQMDLAPHYQRFVEIAAAKQVAIELNTAGWRKDCQECYPAPSILALARKAGVAITFGSDSHAPAEVGADFGRAIELARAAGFTHWRRLVRGQAESVEL